MINHNFCSILGHPLRPMCHKFYLILHCTLGIIKLGLSLMNFGDAMQELKRREDAMARGSSIVHMNSLIKESIRLIYVVI